MTATPLTAAESLSFGTLSLFDATIPWNKARVDSRSIPAPRSELRLAKVASPGPEKLGFPSNHRRIFHAADRNEGKRRRGRGTEASRSRRLRPTVIGTGRPHATFDVHGKQHGRHGSTGTLRWAINQANQNGQANTIVFSSLFNTPQTITLTGGTLELMDTAKTTITGPGANLLTVNGPGAAARSSKSPTVRWRTCRGLRSPAATTTDTGGGVFNDDGQLTMKNVVVRN